MRLLTLRIAGIVLALAVLGSVAEAQRRVRRRPALVTLPRPSVGPRIGYDFDANQVFLGGQLNLPVVPRWVVAPSAEIYTGGTGTPYRLNADLKYHPPSAYGFFYLGGGFAILHAAGTTHGGVSAFAGWEGRRALPFQPFAEGRFVFSSTTSFNILGGINVPL